MNLRKDHYREKRLGCSAELGAPIFPHETHVSKVFTRPDVGEKKTHGRVPRRPLPLMGRAIYKPTFGVLNLKFFTAKGDGYLASSSVPPGPGVGRAV